MNYSKILYILFFLLFCTWPTCSSQSKSKVHLNNSDKMTHDEKLYGEGEFLQGNVKFTHDDVVMFCDSAFFYQKDNSLDAYGSVHIIRSDTLHIYSDRLFYQGNIKLAQFRKNVRLLNLNTTDVLTTDSLNYDRIADVAYYFNGGKLKDSVNTLTSVDGKYFPQTNIAHFNKKVILNNENFDLFSDTLIYNANTKIANIIGPTNIKTKDTTLIYAEKGYYDTQNRNSELNKNAVIYSKEYKIKANRLIYNESKKDVHAYGNMSILDTLRKVIIKGEEGYFNKTTKYAMAKDKALFIEFSTLDSLFVHADRFDAFPDSIYRKIYANHNVRFYRIDVQGKCDSMELFSRDSLIHMYVDPVIWSQKNQISGDEIDIYTKDGNVDR